MGHPFVRVGDRLTPRPVAEDRDKDGAPQQDVDSLMVMEIGTSVMVGLAGSVGTLRERLASICSSYM